MYIFFLQLVEVESEMSVLNQWSQLMSRRDVDLTAPNLHPRVRSLLKRRQQLQNTIEDLKHNIAFRPQPSQVS